MATSPPARPDQVSVRRLACFATPLPSSQPHGFRLAVHYAWRQVPATGLPPARSAPCPAHHKRGTAWQCLCFVMSDLADTASPSFCFVQIRLHRIGRCRKDGAVSAGKGAGESGPAELGGPCAESANQILGTPFRREEIVYASGQSVIHSLRAASTAGVYSSEWICKINGLLRSRLSRPRIDLASILAGPRRTGRLLICATSYLMEARNRLLYFQAITAYGQRSRGKRQKNWPPGGRKGRLRRQEQ